MSSAFARALPQAKVTRHDPSVVQIVTAPHSYLTRGDVGVKSNINVMISDAQAGRTGNTRYLHIKDIDSPIGTGLEWHECEHPVILRREFRELNAPLRAEQNIIGRPMESLSSLNQPSSYSSLLKKKRAFQVPLYSRFDRSSRAKAKAQGRTTNHNDPNANGNGKKQEPSSAVVPHYSLMPEKEFQHLLQMVRRRRDDFVREKANQIADARRVAKFQQAMRQYNIDVARREDDIARGVTRKATLPLVQPKLEDFPREQELPAAYANLERKAGDDDATSHSHASRPDPLVDPLDLFNLARSTRNSEVADFIKTLFAAKTIENPRSTAMPNSDSRQSASAWSTRLHSLGGLQYSQPDPIFAANFQTPVPGHVIGQDGGSQSVLRSATHRKDWLVSVASTLASLSRAKSYGTDELDWRRQDLSRGAPQVKVEGQATLKRHIPALSMLSKSNRFSPSTAGWPRGLAHLNLGYVDLKVKNAIRDIEAQADKMPAGLTREQQLQWRPRPERNVIGSRDWMSVSQETPPAARELTSALARRPGYYSATRPGPGSAAASFLRGGGGADGQYEDDEEDFGGDSLAYGRRPSSVGSGGSRMSLGRGASQPRAGNGLFSDE